MSHKCSLDLNGIPKSKEYWKHIILAALITTHILLNPSVSLFPCLFTLSLCPWWMILIIIIYCIRMCCMCVLYSNRQANHYPLSKIYRSKNRQNIISRCNRYGSTVAKQFVLVEQFNSIQLMHPEWIELFFIWLFSFTQSKKKDSKAHKTKWYFNSSWKPNDKCSKSIFLAIERF